MEWTRIALKMWTCWFLFSAVAAGTMRDDKGVGDGGGGGGGGGGK